MCQPPSWCHGGVPLTDAVETKHSNGSDVVGAALSTISEALPRLPRPLSLAVAMVVQDTEGPILLCHRLVGGVEVACKYLVAIAAGVEYERTRSDHLTSSRLALGDLAPLDHPTASNWASA